MTTRQTEGTLVAAARLEAREVRSYEAGYSGEQNYNRKHHGEIDDTPLARFLSARR